MAEEFPDVSEWLKSQTDTFETKRRYLIFKDLVHKPSGQWVKEGFRYFDNSTDVNALVEAFDNDDVEAIMNLTFAADENGSPDTSGILIDLAYMKDGSFLAAQPQQYIDYRPVGLRAPKYLTIPAGFNPRELDQAF